MGLILEHIPPHPQSDHGLIQARLQELPTNMWFVPITLKGQHMSMAITQPLSIFNFKDCYHKKRSFPKTIDGIGGLYCCSARIASFSAAMSGEEVA